MPPIDSAILNNFFCSMDSIANYGNSSFVSSLFIRLGGTARRTEEGLEFYSTGICCTGAAAFLIFLGDIFFFVAGGAYFYFTSGAAFLGSGLTG